MNIFTKLGRLIRSPVEAARLLAEIVHQSRLMNANLKEVIQALDNEQRILNDKLNALVEGSSSQSRILNDKLKEVIVGLRNQSSILNDKLTGAHDPAAVGSRHSFQDAMQCLPLLLDERTYNTSHPDYDATLVRNQPGRILNADVPCGNPAFAEVKQMATADAVPDEAWTKVLEDTFAEVNTISQAQQIFDRRRFIELHMAELNRKYQGHYAPGWVNLDDALFLYWLVRRVKPKTIVQIGVCNGLSSAFMMLALTMNGPEGRLHAIDVPQVFNAQDPNWTVKNKVYGEVIPAGRFSGWMVPDACRDRFEVWSGDAEELLPKLIDKLDGINLFYHDSDHTYNHMMFEFREAARTLKPGGLIVADNISWNASLWDFADEQGVPSYNFKGEIGVAFF
jgi:predicted O-methyltransferase YrrM